MASFGSYHCVYCRNNTSGVTGGCRNWPLPGIPGHICSSILPPHGYALSQIENASSFPEYATDQPFNYYGLDSGLAGLDQTFNELTAISGSSNYLLPLDRNSLLSDQPNRELDSFNPAACFVGLNGPPWTSDPQSYLIPSQAMPTQSTGLNYTDSAGMLNENVPISDEESSFFGNAAHCTNPYNNDVQRAFHVDYGTSNSQGRVDDSPLFFMTDVQSYSSDALRSPGSAPSYSLDLLFQNEGISDPALQENVIDIPLQTHQTYQSPGGASLNSYNSLSSKGHSAPLDSDLDTSASPTTVRKMPKYHNIAPKPTASSPEAAEGINSSDGVRKVVKKGVRKGPLKPTTRQKASKVRKAGACARCYRSHLSCSVGEICLNCKKMYERGRLDRLGCQRGPMQEYTKLFFPSLIPGHLDQWSNEAWIKENNVVFTENQLTVQVSSDPFSISMPVDVHEIASANQDCSSLPELNSESCNQTHGFVSRPTLPYGIANFDIVKLEKSLLEYVNSVSNYPLDDAETIIGDSSPIIWKVLRAICRFHQANPIVKQKGLLRKAINAYWVNYLISRSITFTDDSALEAIESLQNSSIFLPLQPFISAGVLSYQIHGLMSHLFEKILCDLFEGLEKESRKNRTSWAICFCTNLILCMLVEQLQVDIDALVIHKIFSEGEDPTNTRKSGANISQDLEELPIKYSWTLFKGIQRTYNPVRDGCPIDNNSGQNQGEAELIIEICELLNNNEDEVSKLVTDSCTASETPEEHFEFRKRNSARQVCRFLRMFC